MKNAVKEKVLVRMNYLVGHLKGVIKMIKDDRYCIDIIRQNQAVIAAIKKVNEIILQSHLRTCVKKAVESRDKKEQEKVFKEIVGIFREKR